MERKRVVGAVIVQDGKILIAQRKDEGPFPGKWEFPGGKVALDETDEQALTREISEELLGEILVGELIVEKEYEYPFMTVHLHFYECEWLSLEPPQIRIHQQLAWAWPYELENYDFLEADQTVLPVIAKRFMQ